MKKIYATHGDSMKSQTIMPDTSLVAEATRDHERTRNYGSTRRFGMSWRERVRARVSAWSDLDSVRAVY